MLQYDIYLLKIVTFLFLFLAYVDILGKYSFSMGMFLPEYKIEKTNFFHQIPNYNDKICRILFRTPVTNLRSDINGLDLYTSSILGIDRYEIASKLFSELKLNFKNI